MELSMLPDSSGRLSISKVQGFLFFLSAALLLNIVKYSLVDWDNRTLFLYASTLTVGSLIYVALVSNRNLFSASFMYLLIFSLFHSGLYFAYAMGLEEPTSYLLTYSGRLAVILVVIGTLAYCAGVSAAYFFGGSAPFCRIKNPEKLGGAFEWTGLILMILSVGIWFFEAIRAGGIGIFQAAYLDFLSATEGSYTGWAYYGLGLAMVFLGTCEPSRLRRGGFALFGLFALVAFPLGLRGEVLYPLTAALVVMGVRKAPFSTGKALIIGLLVLCAITGVRQIRSTGVGEISGQQVSFAPSEALAEMGSSIRPVVKVIRWSQSGDPFIYGQSYWAPFDRAFVYVLPGWTRPPAQDDSRLLNVLVQKRVGPIGFSVIAEAYRNFAAPGVTIVMFLIGFGFGRMDRWPHTLIGQTVTGVILVAFLIQIRNAFTQVPMQIILGFMVLSLVVFLSKISSYKTQNFKPKLERSSNEPCSYKRT